jgi:5'(3')-deoxyribonucleotidase
MEKIKLFLDFDSTIVDSLDTYCKVYNELYKNREEFIKAKPSKVERYDLRDECPLVENINDIFASEMFFNKLEFINRNTKNVIKQLSEIYNIYICSIGVPKNLSLKVMWLNKHLPFVDNYILLSNGKNKCAMNKSIVDMSNAVFIDDVASNLISSNAKWKFVFGTKYEWNEKATEERLFDWSDV